MNLINKISNHRIAVCISIAFILSLVGALTAEKYQNNFKIFQAAQEHFFARLPLYKPYPEKYFDVYMFGPVFAILMTGFCKMGFHIDKLLWVLFNFGIYIYSIKKLFNKNSQHYVYWILICFQDIYISGLSFEVTIGVVGIIIIAYLKYHEERALIFAGFLSGLFAMIKLFPVLTLMYLSSKIQWKYVLGFLIGIAFSVLIPVFLTDYNYVQSSYSQWVEAILLKDTLNSNLNPMIDYSLPGMFRKNLENPLISTIPFVITGFLCLCGICIKNLLSGHLKEELLVLSLLTCFVFSSNSESPTIILSSTAVAIWWCLVEKNKTKWHYLFLACYLMFTAYPSIDGYPTNFRQQILHERGFRGLMPCLLWFYLVIKSFFKSTKKPLLTNN